MRWLVDSLELPSSWAFDYLHIFMSIIVLAIIVISAMLVYPRLKQVEYHLIPQGGTTLINFFEVISGALLRIMTDVIGPAAGKHFPLIASVFVYILIGSLIGVVPGLASPTENVNTNLAVAIVVFVYYNGVGIRTHGLRGYIKQMSGPIIWLMPLILMIEIISHVVRPVSLSIRLLGNIYGDHVVLGMFSELTPLLIPIIFMVMAIFVAFIQAFVFTLLSIIYIGLAEKH
jgi:F-type H+-transporting ATPase subunit a